MPSSVTAGIAKVPGVTDVSGFRSRQLPIPSSDEGGDVRRLTATAAKLVDIKLRSGSWTDLKLNKVFVYTDVCERTPSPRRVADARAVPVGRSATADGGGHLRRLEHRGQLRARLLDVQARTSPARASISSPGARVVPGQSVRTVQERVATYLDKVDPAVKVQNRKEFQQTQEDQVNQFLAVINGLLFLAVVIALIGIANTLALSVFERTRELGLMRAVGMQRTQTKSIVRWESVLVAVFGALLGIVLGVVLGHPCRRARCRRAVVSSIAIPATQLFVYVVLAIVAGTISAYFPARRAAKMNVLAAIAHE